MTHMHKALIIIGLSLATLTACHIQPETPPAPAPWQLLDANPGIRNLQVVEDRLLVQTANSIYFIDSTGSQSPCLTFDSLHPNVWVAPVSNSIVVLPSKDGQFLDFYPSRNLCGGGAVKRVDLSQTDIPSQLSVPTLGFDFMLATDNGQLITALKIGTYEYGLFLFSVDFTNADQTAIDTIRIQKIEVPEVDFFLTSQIFKGKPFFSYTQFDGDVQQTIRIEPDGSVKEMLPDIMQQFFTLDSIWYAVGLDHAYQTADDGNTWTYLSNAYDKNSWPNAPGTTTFETIYGKLTAIFNYGGDHLYVIEEEADPNLGKFWEVDITGIPSLFYLTDKLVEWNGRVYLKTREGIFSRSLVDFFTPKG